jgi:hypothetical protein
MKIDMQNNEERGRSPKMVLTDRQIKEERIEK